MQMLSDWVLENHPKEGFCSILIRRQAAHSQSRTDKGRKCLNTEVAGYDRGISKVAPYRNKVLGHRA